MEFIVVTGDIDYGKRNETVILTGFVIHEQAEDTSSQGETEDDMIVWLKKSFKI